MLKHNYTLEALSHAHTGGGDKTGIIALLNREKRELKQPIVFESKFRDKRQRQEYIVAILVIVFKNISSSTKKGTYGFYEAFASKVLEAVCVPTKEEFLSTLCESCDIRAIKKIADNQLLIEALAAFEHDELLETIRKEHILIHSKMTVAYKDDETPISLSPLPEKGSKLIFKKKFEWIPYFPGNGIRGKIRRLITADFLERIGIADESIPDFLYAVMYDGGVMHNVEELNKELVKIRKLNPSFLGGDYKFVKGQDNITLKEKLFAACPTLELLGCAIGNMTYEGTLGVRAARPICAEHGYEDAPSYWEMISTVFETHLDNNIKTHSAVKKTDVKGLTNTQMKHKLEVLNIGTKFFSSFFCSAQNEVTKSLYYHMLGLWKDYGHIGGKSAVGFGQVSMDLEIPEGANKLYLDYVAEHKDMILDFISVIPSAEVVETKDSKNGVLVNV